MIRLAKNLTRSYLTLGCKKL